MKYQRPEPNRKDAGEDVQVKEEREPGGRNNRTWFYNKTSTLALQ